MQAFVEIILKDESSELVPIRKSRVTVGSGRSADIPIPWAQGLQPIHFMLVPSEEACWVTAQAGAELFAAGSAIKHGAVPWGTTLEVAGLRLRLLDETLVQPTGRAAGMWVWLLALLAVPFIAWLFTDSNKEMIKKPPAVDIEHMLETDIGCGEGGPAHYRAERHMISAVAKQERYPFDPNDGVQAVGLYRKAATCYEAVGEPKSAQHARTQASRLASRIRIDFQVHQTRLERSVKYQAYSQALVEARFLQRLVIHKKTEYSRWIDGVERRLSLAVAEGAEE